MRRLHVDNGLRALAHQTNRGYRTISVAFTTSLFVPSPIEVAVTLQAFSAPDTAISLALILRVNRYASPE